MPETMCACGLPLHYGFSEKARALKMNMEIRSAVSGPTVEIEFEGYCYIVQWHYIALHDMKPCQLPYLGFPRLFRDAFAPRALYPP